MLGSSEPACPFADSSVPNPRLWKAGKCQANLERGRGRGCSWPWLGAAPSSSPDPGCARERGVGPDRLHGDHHQPASQPRKH